MPTTLEGESGSADRSTSTGNISGCRGHLGPQGADVLHTHRETRMWLDTK